ncbi:N(5)-(carboxyethyl)ornithine synthase [Senegalia sp. (in: firmicutes)]|uniref:N(5)-(carboxyethyl)ornithine synthase n=1 Tax=Senegalia sp. (in: firmicutes) TaxID=1924098 RepID=UPI003F9501E8
MKLGFIKPNYSNEKRVALLPEDIKDFQNDIVIEEGFGEYLDIEDEEYQKAGCEILSRKKVYEKCDSIFSLKLIQPSDYEMIREGQMIIGWTHPTGSGSKFMEEQAIPKNLIVVDLDNIYPAIYYKNKKIDIDFIPRNFVAGNSFNAGYAATMHALLSYGLVPTFNTKVAILAAGNVSQGAFYAISKLGAQVRLYYRKTMDEFKRDINEYDVIINGIEVDTPNTNIITKKEQERIKKNCLIIDAAADAGNAIEGTRYTTIDNPIYKEDNIYFYEVNNAPSIFYRETSRVISESFSKHVYKRDIKDFYDLAKSIK